MLYTYKLTINGKPTKARLKTDKKYPIGKRIINELPNGRTREYKIIEEVKQG